MIANAPNQPDKQQPPKHLQARGKAYYRLVLRDFQLEADQLELLVAACECLDAADAARKRLKRDGRYVQDRFGQTKAHPACDEQRKALAEFRQRRRELALDVETQDRPRGAASANFR